MIKMRLAERRMTAHVGHHHVPIDCDLLFNPDGPTTNPLFLVYTAVATNHQTRAHLKAKQQELDEPEC